MNQQLTQSVVLIAPHLWVLLTCVSPKLLKWLVELMLPASAKHAGIDDQRALTRDQYRTLMKEFALYYPGVIFGLSSIATLGVCIVMYWYQMAINSLALVLCVEMTRGFYCYCTGCKYERASNALYVMIVITTFIVVWFDMQLPRTVVTRAVSVFVLLLSVALLLFIGRITVVAVLDPSGGVDVKQPAIVCACLAFLHLIELALSCLCKTSEAREPSYLEAFLHFVFSLWGIVVLVTGLCNSEQRVRFSMLLALFVFSSSVVVHSTLNNPDWCGTHCVLDIRLGLCF